MNRNFHNKKITTRIIIAIVIVLICMFTPMLSWLGNSLGIVVTPVQTGVTGIYNSIQGTIGFWSRVKTVDAENRKLKEQLSKLEAKSIDYDRLKEQNEKYKELLDVKERYQGSDSVAAVVVGRDANNWLSVISLNKGSASGIKNENPVYNASGLVGKTISVGVNWSKVETVIDAEHSVSGIVARTGDLVQIDGDLKLMKSGMCKMTIIGENTDVIIGDAIETSGIGGVYPKGILIGTVREFRTNEEGTGSYAVIKPAVDIEHITDALVMLRPAEDYDFSKDDEENK